MELNVIAGHAGHERRKGLADPGLLAHVLDEIDHGMLLLTGAGALRYANQPALGEVLGDGPLCLLQGHVQARHPAEQAALQTAIADALKGLRRLVTLGRDGSAVSVAVLPMPGGEGGEALALLVLGKRHSCEPLTVDFFARAHALTGAEARVLKALCDGTQPREIARLHTVKISTVRSHICSIRQKTRADSIRHLVHQVTKLPPITPLLKPARRRASPSAGQRVPSAYFPRAA